MQAVVIVFPGSNCDRDVAVALERAAGKPPLMIWHRETDLPLADLIVLPGGFSYGDYLRAGAMAAQSPVMREVRARAGAGVPVLGICNGFQILTECGLLPGALLRNSGLAFVCRDVWLRVETADSVHTRAYRPGEVVRFPIAHHDGNFRADPDTVRALEDGDRIAFRYCNPAGEVGGGANPNGSVDDIAGILNERRNVLGLMPHPERLADPRLGGADGARMFAGLVQALA
ncbi:MAG: phosphoribosylformylglycinamidine synthase subunit PurQ [Proteobacteria bacterium]|nr:phosphoribosylformylglycinamidine synthase subunit PurQ [Pseudomonadota bacterium]